MARIGGHVRVLAASRPWLMDGALAALVTVVSLPPLWQLDEATLAAGFEGPSPLTVTVALAMTVPLTWRRRAPLTVLCVILVGYLAAAPLAVPGLPLGILIGTYTLAANASRAAVAWGVIAVAISTVVSLAIVGQLRSLAPNLLVLAATALFGDWQRLQRARSRELVRREEQLRRARQELTRLAVERERQRIAEEVRDVLAHAVTAMITQAQAARRLLVKHADRAAAPLEAIEETGRAALLELRHLVGLLRDESTAPSGDDVEGENVTQPVSPTHAAPGVAGVRQLPTGSVERRRDPADVVGSEPSWLEGGRRRFAAMSPITRDIVLVLAVVTAELSLQLATYGLGSNSVLLVTLAACTLLLRRRYPQAVLALSLAGTVGIVLLEIPTVFNVVLVAMYTVANLCPRRVRIFWLVTSIVVAGWLLLPEGLGYLAGQLLFIGGAWLLGDRQRVSGEFQRELVDRARQLEEAQQRAVDLEVAFERTRIARDLHDVIGNSIGVMLVQASGARRTLPRDPGRADAALEHVLACGRESLAHLRTVIPTGEDEGGGLAPQPGLEDLPELAADIALAGLHVDFRVDGEPRPVPAGVGLSAYRIIQEALTNVLKHAATDQALVRLTYGDTLVVEITDEGHGSVGGAILNNDLGVSGGHGLIGMAERVRLVGGELDAGPHPEGGFRILARLPVVLQEVPDITPRAMAAR